MSIVEAIREHVREHGRGMMGDLLFAVAWATLVEVVFAALGGPRWAYYLSMVAGVVAYFGFVASLQAARERA